MFVTGPDVVKTVTNEVVTQEALGGAVTHTTKTSVADNAFEDDIEALLAARDFIDFLPASNREPVPERPSSDPWDRIEDSLDTLIPASANQPYDMHELIRKTVDEGDFFEIQPKHAARTGSRGMRIVFPLAIAALSLTAPAGAAPRDPLIARVETQLGTAVEIAGTRAPKRTLAGEMAAKHVPGVSIAVIHGGRIAWAKGYGEVDAKGWLRRLERGRDVEGALVVVGGFSRCQSALGALGGPAC